MHWRYIKIQGMNWRYKFIPTQHYVLHCKDEIIKYKKETVYFHEQNIA